ncbi:MAG: hypothetical protein WD875_18080 [Pirellulales bacterium]
MHRTTHISALLAAIAICAVPSIGCRAVCTTDNCESEPLALRRPLSGRLATWKASCAEHFAEEPVVAPQSRFHPVPTRPVFSPPPAEELAALFTPLPPKETPAKESPTTDNPPKASAGATPTTQSPIAQSPARNAPSASEPSTDAPTHEDRAEHDRSPSDDSPSCQKDEAVPDETLPPPDETPTRTARHGSQLLPTSTPKSLKSTDSDGKEKAVGGVIHSTFGPNQIDAPIPGESFETAARVDDPLLWRAIRTPAGSLRAVPANE